MLKSLLQVGDQDSAHSNMAMSQLHNFVTGQHKVLGKHKQVSTLHLSLQVSDYLKMLSSLCPLKGCVLQE